jgi:hypothetical protein
MEGTEIRDTDTGEPLTWGELIFLLHKHCHLDKWKIRGYTYPQIQDLLRQTHKNIRFELETRMSPFGMFGGGGGGTATVDARDDEPHEANEDDINMLARVLGGG